MNPGSDDVISPGSNPDWKTNEDGEYSTHSINGLIKQKETRMFIWETFSVLISVLIGYVNNLRRDSIERCNSRNVYLRNLLPMSTLPSQLRVPL